jgi:hypothetical protein
MLCLLCYVECADGLNRAIEGRADQATGWR